MAVSNSLLSDTITRLGWKKGTNEIEIYSKSQSEWYQGEILNIEYDSQNRHRDMLHVSYMITPEMIREKEVNRMDTTVIRPTSFTTTTTSRKLPKLLPYESNYKFKSHSLYGIIFIGTIRKFVSPHKIEDGIIPTDVMDLIWNFYQLQYRRCLLNDYNNDTQTKPRYILCILCMYIYFYNLK